MAGTDNEGVERVLKEAENATRNKQALARLHRNQQAVRDMEKKQAQQQKKQHRASLCDLSRRMGAWLLKAGEDESIRPFSGAAILSMAVTTFQRAGFSDDDIAEAFEMLVDQMDLERAMRDRFYAPFLNQGARADDSDKGPTGGID